MAKVKFSSGFVVLKMSVREAKYVHAALNKCGPHPKNLFSLEEDHHDPVYEALGDLLEDSGLGTSVLCARTVDSIMDSGL